MSGSRYYKKTYVIIVPLHWSDKMNCEKKKQTLVQYILTATIKHEND